MHIVTKKGLSFSQKQKYTAIKKGGKMSEEIQKNPKNPPFHKHMLAVFTGEHDEVLEKLGLLSWEDMATRAYDISQSHIPKEDRLDLTAALINHIRDYPFDGECLIHEAYAMAIISMDMEDSVGKVLVSEEDTLEGEEKRNLEALNEAIARILAEPEKSEEPSE